MRNFNPLSKEKLNEKINARIDKALVKKQLAEKPRDYLGASLLSHECPRYIFLENKGTTSFPGKILRRFELGHLEEDTTVDWLRKAGFRIKNIKKDGSQFGFSILDGKIKGHVDGIITSGVMRLPYPLLFEHKIMKSTYFKKLAKNGLQLSNPNYYAQVQWYMHYSDQYYKQPLRRCLFVVKNTDTSELYCEIIEYSAMEMQQQVDKAAMILKAESYDELKPAALSKFHPPCVYCPHKQKCFGE
ncbi:MAG: hypothetical protein GY793_08455 [Proteobacteria bacterium]|nr:hypothetical protein [Pseudomonadota bacterium]